MLIPVSVLQSGPNSTVIAPAVAGYVGWWDASDTSTASMTFDTSGLRASTWKDKSGSGFDGAATNSLIGLIGVHPTKMNQRVLINDQGTYYSTSCPADDRTQTVFFVGVSTDVATRPLVGANNTAGRLIRIEGGTGGKISVLSQFTTNLFTTSTLSVAIGIPFVCCVILDTNTIEVRLNNGTPESTSNATTFTAGRITNIGADVSGGQAFDGWIGEVVIYGTALSGANVSAVMNGLMAKWAIS